MTRQSLSRRIEDINLLHQELDEWSGRNEHATCIQWQFTPDNARTKLVSLYPKFSPVEGIYLTRYNIDITLDRLLAFC